MRARNRRPLTIQSYLVTGRHFAAYLAERDMPTQPARITREHVEAYLADATDRGLAATTVARFCRNLQQLYRDSVSAPPGGSYALRWPHIDK
jgi:site-specific recombinase XerD